MDFETLIAALGGKLFVDRFAETAARWIALLADYRPVSAGGPEAAHPSAADGFLTV